MRRMISISGLLELRSYQSPPASVPTGGIFGLKQTSPCVAEAFRGTERRGYGWMVGHSEVILGPNSPVVTRTYSGVLGHVPVTGQRQRRGSLNFSGVLDF